MSTTLATGPVAEALHSAAVRLLRLLRAGDADGGLTGPQASALSVLVFGGEMTLGALAVHEQVSAPTVSRLVRDMEAQGLVQRRANAADGRSVLISATPQGEALLRDARARRLARLEETLGGLGEADLKLLDEATALIGRLAEAENARRRQTQGLSPRPREP